MTPNRASPWWELLDTPLMLNIATLTYAGQAGQPLPTAGTPEALRDQLFTAYVARMFQRNRPQLRFSHHQTVRWLSWLAWQMQQHNQSVVYLEHLQPEWLPTGSARWQYALLDRVGGGLIVGLVFGLVFGLTAGLVFGPVSALVVGSFQGLLAALLTALFGPVLLQRSPMQQGVVQRIKNTLIGGLVVGLVGGLAHGGYACLSHTALRLILWQKGAMPLSYASFLDENAQRILLRKVGGGYMFIHRMLLDYFAQQYTDPETTDV